MAGADGLESGSLGELSGAHASPPNRRGSSLPQNVRVMVLCAVGVPGDQNTQTHSSSWPPEACTDPEQQPFAILYCFGKGVLSTYNVPGTIQALRWGLPCNMPGTVLLSYSKIRVT